MLPLAFNTLLPQSMRPKCQIALAILPIGLMFASFLPLFLLVPWFESAMGLPPGAPVRSHPNGWLWVTAFLAAFVFGMIVAYLLGWVLNALISRYVLGWPTSTVVAVYWRSEVPSHWLKDEKTAQTLRGSSSTSLAKWEAHHSAGPLKFILTRGVLAWGAPMFVAMYLVPTWSRGGSVTSAGLMFHLALWVAAGGGFGIAIWYFSEWNYRKSKAKNEP